MKKSIFLFLSLLLLCLGLTGCTEEKVDLKPHFTVNGTTYWTSPAPLTLELLEGFESAGTIQSETSDRAVEDWQANGPAVGSEVWLNPDIPYQAFIDGKHLYVTEEAGRRYLLHDGEMYVYLGSVQSYDGEYYAQYRDSYDLTIPKEKLPTDAVELGTSTFGQYYRYPTKELESNLLTKPHTVYQDSADLNVLYALSEGGTASVYIKCPS